MEYYAGIDLGGTNIKCGIVDETGTVIKYESIPTNREKGFSDVVSTMAELVKKLSKAVSGRVKAVGVGAPGTIDGENGVVVYSNNLAWEKVPLAAELGNELHLPVRITNDANAAAYGEYLCGAGKEYRSIVMLTLGTGVGSGIVIDGKLFEGNRGAGAELGHEVIRFGGEKCTCGRCGCFEAYASATALIRQTKRAMEHHVESIMWKLCSADINNVNGRTAFDGMRSGDKTAKKVVDSYINYLSVGGNKRRKRHSSGSGYFGRRSLCRRRRFDRSVNEKGGKVCVWRCSICARKNIDGFFGKYGRDNRCGKSV